MTGILRHLDGWVAAARGGEMVATDRIAAAADEIDPSYSPSGANVYRIWSVIHCAQTSTPLDERHVDRSSNSAALTVETKRQADTHQSRSAKTCVEIGRIQTLPAGLYYPLSPNARFRGAAELGPPKTWFPGPPRLNVPNGMSIASALFDTAPGCDNRQTDRHTDHATSVAIGRIDLCTACMRCGLVVTKKDKGSSYSITERRVPELIPVLGNAVAAIPAVLERVNVEVSL